ncbi:MAG: DNA polymerase III subunit gamma/tau [bacterium]|nr:DNA polymerase III subunit gamma/tau [bacterium]
MAYEVLARKWRPRTFDDVVGQDHVTRTLAHAIEQDRIAHAYLFIGPRGIGKTTLSRIFAMALNCEKGPTMQPCGECESCKGVTQGADMDVIELDAASNNKVEDIHNVIDQVQFAPTHSRFKIFILDEVHMLTPAAFNALLKTLEEPPPHVKFIFATTEGDKVLPTIISRCQRFDLRRISIGDIMRRLRFICNAEQITITDDALLAIARGSKGGLRDALSALDQLIAFKGTTLEEADVLAVFGLISRGALETLAMNIIKGDVAEILKAVDALDATGKDMRRFTTELLGHFRNLLVYQQAGAELAQQDVTADQIEVLADQARMIDARRIAEIATMLSEMETKLRSSLSVRTLVEMTLIRCARAAKAVSLDEVIRRLNDLRTQTIQRLAAVAPSRSTAAEAATSMSAAPQVVTPPPPPPSPPPASLEIFPLAHDEPLDSIDEEGFDPEESLRPVAAPKTEMRTIKIETLKQSNGQYVDEILNVAVEIFNGAIVSIQEKQ